MKISNGGTVTHTETVTAKHVSGTSLKATVEVTRKDKQGEIQSGIVKTTKKIATLSWRQRT